MTVASLSDLEGEKLALATQPTISQPVGTRSGKQYLWQYDQTPDGAPQPTTLETAAPFQATVPKNKEKHKEIHFDEFLKKNLSRGLNAPFRFDIYSQLAKILARIILHELLHLSKKTREALRDALPDSESFLTQMSFPTKEYGASCPQCYLVQQQVPCITFIPEDILLKDNQHDRPLY